MTARKPLHEDCTGSINCPVEEHTVSRRTRNGWRFSHISLTRGQDETLADRREAEGAVIFAALSVETPNGGDEK